MRRTAARLSLALLALAAALPAHAQGETVAIRAGRILTMAGEPIENGTIVVRDGRIVSVAPGSEVPEGARVIDASASVVMPGLVDASALYGLRGDTNEDSSEITPGFRISAAVDDAGDALRRALQYGVTTAAFSPGNSDVIGGSGVVFKTAGGPAGAVPLLERRELKVVVADDPGWGNDIPWYTRPDSFYYRQPTTLMGVVWMLRQALSNAQTGRAGTPDPALMAALAGEIPVRVLVRTAVNVETTLKVADEFGLKHLVFEECTEGYRIAERIAERDIPVILGPLFVHPSEATSRWYPGGRVSYNNAGLLAAAGVRVAIASNDASGPASLLTAAAMAFRGGMKEDDALRAITRTPSEILGVSDRVGTLEAGKDADLVILSGAPLQFTTRIEKVLVGGQVVLDTMGADADG